ncbi:hypothetical protein BD410DRAFT_809419 [Rickenella mellea]|uniref:Uncharacterized protein n=1 Tax=Rickenella mellea TaxID=50990 RepID=A0A4Y7PIA3_9AGAM|nr:hypothetical protein BD410DRAFT_809419 [Rickenella mellea]
MVRVGLQNTTTVQVYRDVPSHASLIAKAKKVNRHVTSRVVGRRVRQKVTRKQDAGPVQQPVVIADEVLDDNEWFGSGEWESIGVETTPRKTRSRVEMSTSSSGSKSSFEIKNTREYGSPVWVPMGNL